MTKKKAVMGRPKKPAKEIKKQKTIRVSELDEKLMRSYGFLSVQHFFDFYLKRRLKRHENENEITS